MRGSAPPLCFFKSGGTGAPFAPLTSPPTCIYPLSMSKVSLWLLGLQAYPKKYIYIIYSVVHIAAMKLILMGHDTCAACDMSCVASPVWSDTAIYGCQLRQCTLPFHAYCCYVRPYLLNMLLLGSDCFPSWKKVGVTTHYMHVHLVYLLACKETRCPVKPFDTDKHYWVKW